MKLVGDTEQARFASMAGIIFCIGMFAMYTAFAIMQQSVKDSE